MKGFIIFKGKYGATKQYAEWLGNDLALPVVPPENYRKQDIADCDFVVIGSSVYIGQLQIREWIKRNVADLMSKKIFLFIVCGTPPDEKVKLQSYVQGSVPTGIRNQCQTYFLPGRLVYKNLSWRDKFMLRMGAMLTKEASTKKTMLKDYDGVRKENLETLVKDIKEFAGAASRSSLSAMK